MDLARLALPLSAATAALVRLDERVARSPVGEGLLQRLHFADACASLWIDGELVHLEDLVLHDSGHDSRTPSHELTIAADILRQRRRILSHPADWALSHTGLSALRRTRPEQQETPLELKSANLAAPEEMDELDSELAAMDAILNKSEVLLREVHKANLNLDVEKEALVYDPNWNEEERLADWLRLAGETAQLPPVLECVVLLDRWNKGEVLQHGHWLGRLLAASVLRKRQVVTGSHLPALNIALKLVKREDRSVRDQTQRLANMLGGLQAMADYALKEHDRLLLAKKMMSRHLAGRRSSSRLPKLIELVLSKPVVSTEIVATELAITQRAALRLIEELTLREVTGRGRFRAWGIL